MQGIPIMDVEVQSKKLLLTRTPGGTTYQIYYEGGGEVPESLRGEWTRADRANSAIDEYLAVRDKPRRPYNTDKGVEGGKNKSSKS